MKIKSYLKTIGVTAAALCLAGAVQGQTILISDTANSTIGAFNAVTGATINASFISMVSGSSPRGVVYGDGYIYTANLGKQTVGKFDAVTGATVNESFISGLTGASGITYSNGFVYVSNLTSGSIGKYDAVTGDAVNASLISGLSSPSLLTAYNGNLYIPVAGGSVGLYSENGDVINASFLSGMGSAFALTIYGSDIYVSQSNEGIISKFDLLTGAAINLNFITGLDNPLGLTVNPAGNLVVAQLFGAVNEYTTAGVAVNAPWFTGGGLIVGATMNPVPEPGTMALLGLSALLVVGVLRKKMRRNAISLE